jgi:hypothetical protein
VTWQEQELRTEAAGFIPGWFPRFSPQCGVCGGPIYHTHGELVTILMPLEGVYAHRKCAERLGINEVSL